MSEKNEKAGEILKKALNDLGRIPENGRYPTSTLFTLWFLLARLTDKPALARDSITDGPNDKGCDAVFIDERAEKAFIIQAKHSRRLGEHPEKRDSITSFTVLRERILTDDDSRAQKFLRDADPVAANKLRQARESVRERGFGLEMIFLTCHSVSAGMEEDFKTNTEEQGAVIDAGKLADIIDEWEKGVAPPVHELPLDMDSESHVRYEDKRTDGEKVETWIFPMRGDKVARLFSDTGPRIFAANVRGYLKKTSVNAAMTHTLENDPENFFHRNNGVTISCRGASRTESGVLLVRNPQIINGQQTTRTLAEFARKNPEKVEASRVLVRVFVEERGDKLVSSVVIGVNDQNPIKASDLVSNDARQVALERELRKINIGYQRKRERETKREVELRLRGVMSSVRGVYKKEEFAKAVAGCNMDPAKVRSGLDNLFRDEYHLLFPTDDPYYYLSRRFLVEAVTSCASGNSDRAYAKWMVAGFMWESLKAIITPKERRFCDMWLHKNWGDNWHLKEPLEKSIEMVFVEALKFYREESRKTDLKKRKDLSRFFKDTKDLAVKFRRFWRANASATKRDRFAARLKEVRSALTDWE